MVQLGTSLLKKLSILVLLFKRNFSSWYFSSIRKLFILVYFSSIRKLSSWYFSSKEAFHLGISLLKKLSILVSIFCYIKNFQSWYFLLKQKLSTFPSWYSFLMNKNCPQFPLWLPLMGEISGNSMEQFSSCPPFTEFSPNIFHRNSLGLQKRLTELSWQGFRKLNVLLLLALGVYNCWM